MAVLVYEIPLSGEAQRMTVPLGGVSYRLTFQYRDAVEGGWIMDIADEGDNPIACGLPLITGADLLGQFEHLGIGGVLAINTDGEDSAPTYGGLGTSSRLYWVTVS